MHLKTTHLEKIIINSLRTETLSTSPVNFDYLQQHLADIVNPQKYLVKGC